MFTVEVAVDRDASGWDVDRQQEGWRRGLRVGRNDRRRHQDPSGGSPGRRFDPCERYPVGGGWARPPCALGSGIGQESRSTEKSAVLASSTQTAAAGGRTSNGWGEQ